MEERKREKEAKNRSKRKRGEEWGRVPIDSTLPCRAASPGKRGEERGRVLISSTPPCRAASPGSSTLPSREAAALLGRQQHSAARGYEPKNKMSFMKHT